MKIAIILLFGFGEDKLGTIVRLRIKMALTHAVALGLLYFPVATYPEPTSCLA